jgi:hypothetical protein
MDSLPMQNWNKKKEKLLKRFATLTNEDLSCPVGKEDEMIGIISTKIGKSRKELLNLILEL